MHLLPLKCFILYKAPLSRTLAPACGALVVVIITVIIILISFLTHPHTMTPFDAPGKQAFGKHCRKRRNFSQRAISPFPTVFSTRLENFLQI